MLTDYREQVEFGKRHIKAGVITESGTWQQGAAWGKLWGGRVGRYIVTFKTIGRGPMMRAGSFRVRCT